MISLSRTSKTSGGLLNLTSDFWRKPEVTFMVFRKPPKAFGEPEEVMHHECVCVGGGRVEFSSVEGGTFCGPGTRWHRIVSDMGVCTEGMLTLVLCTLVLQNVYCQQDVVCLTREENNIFVLQNLTGARTSYKHL